VLKKRRAGRTGCDVAVCFGTESYRLLTTGHRLKRDRRRFQEMVFRTFRRACQITPRTGVVTGCKPTRPFPIGSRRRLQRHVPATQRQTAAVIGGLLYTQLGARSVHRDGGRPLMPFCPVPEAAIRDGRLDEAAGRGESPAADGPGPLSDWLADLRKRATMPKTPYRHWTQRLTAELRNLELCFLVLIKIVGVSLR